MTVLASAASFTSAFACDEEKKDVADSSVETTVSEVEEASE